MMLPVGWSQGLARPGPARPGPARPGEARPGEARPGEDRSGPGLPAVESLSESAGDTEPLGGDTPGRMITRSPGSEPEDGGATEMPGERPVLTDADMPDLDTLDENSDYSGFLSPGVSDRLRKLALRKLFSSAGFNIRDGLDDYDDDFTRFTPLGDMVTADMKHRAEVAERRRRAAEAEAEPADGEPEDLRTAQGGAAPEEGDRENGTNGAESHGDPDTAPTETNSAKDAPPELGKESGATQESTGVAARRGESGDFEAPHSRTVVESGKTEKT